MDVDVVTQHVIRRLRGDVACYVTDPDHAPRWHKDVARWVNTVGNVAARVILRVENLACMAQTRDIRRGV